MTMLRVLLFVPLILLASCGSDPVEAKHFEGKWNIYEELNGLEYQAGIITFDATTFELAPVKGAQCEQLFGHFKQFSIVDGNKLKFFGAEDVAAAEPKSIECYIGVENEQRTHLHYNQYSLRLER